VAPQDPCSPSPCGPNSQCKVVSGQAACSCLPNYVGTAPNCRPECTISAECPRNRACQNQQCRNPCLGSCGPQATCQVVNHVPVCTCAPGFTGDPFAGCSPNPPRKGSSSLLLTPSLIAALDFLYIHFMPSLRFLWESMFGLYDLACLYLWKGFGFLAPFNIFSFHKNYMILEVRDRFEQLFFCSFFVHCFLFNIFCFFFYWEVSDSTAPFEMH